LVNFFQGERQPRKRFAALDHVMIHRGKAATKGKTGFTAERWGGEVERL
jgi:hypothetical protein